MIAHAAEHHLDRVGFWSSERISALKIGSHAYGRAGNSHRGELQRLALVAVRNLAVDTHLRGHSAQAGDQRQHRYRV